MYDSASRELVAVKRVPNWWMCSSYQEFKEKHADQSEVPWRDITFARFLESVDFQFLCRLRSVARDEEHSYLVYDYATEGDLFTMATNGPTPGNEREMYLMPVVCQLLESFRQLHELSIAHRDVSLENVVALLDQAEEKREIKVIDFGMATTSRYVRGIQEAGGKPSYMAPELHQDVSCDAFLADAFSLGVVIYTLLLQDYPWMATKPDCCKRFQYVEKHGLRAYMTKQKLRGTQLKIGDCLSEPLKELLEGLLQFDPALRLTLGESVFAPNRRSVWHEQWIQIAPSSNPVKGKS